MTQGRPPAWNPFGGLDPLAWTEIAAISSKGRLSLPVAVRKRLAWFPGAAGEGLLGILEPGGRAELAGWAERGRGAMDEVARRFEAAPPEGRGEIAIAAMDRYMRISVEAPARVALPTNLEAHVDPQGRGLVRLVVGDNRLWLWSEAEWGARRGERVELLMRSA